MKFKEECGIFGGIKFDGDVAPLIRDGLFLLQHRGQENAGLCCGDEQLKLQKGKGLVAEVLTDSAIKNISGHTGIGHVRYSTQGNSDKLHAQPYKIKSLGYDVAIAHNGNVSAAIQIKNELEKSGDKFLTNSDTEIILKKIAKDIKKPPSLWNIEEVGKILTDSFTGGAWSLLLGFPGRIMGFRDPFGYRPLMFCEAEEGYFIASEDCAFKHLTPLKIIEIQPGEAVELTFNGYTIRKFSKNENAQKCAFEQIYFAKPDSNIFGQNVYNTRIELGRQCAMENSVDADVVVPVMDSGFAAAIGYSEYSKIPFHLGLIKNDLEGRSFILPDQKARQKKVLSKFTIIPSVIENKRIILVDDSVVRGTTSTEIVKMLKNAGAKEVHLRLSSPPLINTCEWGVDIPTAQELIANRFKNLADLNALIGSDSIGFLSLKTLKGILGSNDHCYHCFMK